MSEFVKDYTSFWGVPVESEMNVISTNGKTEIYHVEVLESYGRIETKKIEARIIRDIGLDSEIHFEIGVPHFLSVYEKDDGQYWVGTCAPRLPYKAIKNYLENGVDQNIPVRHTCEKYENGNYGFASNKPECAVWEETLKNWDDQPGVEDWQTYVNLWEKRLDTGKRELCYQSIKQAYDNDVAWFHLDDKNCAYYIADYNAKFSRLEPDAN